MCFSANASFAASAVIGTIGLVAIVRTSTIHERLLATIPFIFALQQLAEGFLWLTLHGSTFVVAQSIFKYTFLVSALALWPLYIPLCVPIVEKNKSRKKVLNIFLLTGAGVFVIVLFTVFIFSVSVIPADHHLSYQFNFSPGTKKLVRYFTAIYIIVTIVTPFISSYKKMKWLGIGFLTAYVITILFFPERHSFHLVLFCSNQHYCTLDTA